VESKSKKIYRTEKKKKIKSKSKLPEEKKTVRKCKPFFLFDASAKEAVQVGNPKRWVLWEEKIAVKKVKKQVKE